MKYFRPKTQKAHKAIELWQAWVGTRVSEVGDAGFFISHKDLQEWDDFLVHFVTEMAQIPDGVDF